MGLGHALAVALVLAGCAKWEDVPDPSGRLVDRKVEQWRGWVHSADELRGWLVAVRPGDEDAARILTQVGDAPGALEAWRRVLDGQPADAHPRWHVANELYTLGDDAGVLEVVGASPSGAASTSSHVAAGDLQAVRCGALRRLGRLEEARAPCGAGLSGAQRGTARRAHARLLLTLGEPAGALQDTQTLVDEDSPRSESWFLHGVALDASGRSGDAHDAFDAALRLDPSFAPADRALRGLDATAGERIASEDQWSRGDRALRLAVAGHVYLDLGLPAERAERCFAASERLKPGAAESHRIWHLAETDRTAALARGEAALLRARGPEVLLGVGWIAHEQGDDARARVLLEEAVRLAPRDYQANINLAKLCEKAGDSECADRAYGRALGDPSASEVLVAVGLFAALVAPLGVVYWLVRRRLVRRLAVARARERS